MHLIHYFSSLAKDNMAHPMKPIFYDDDLEQHDSEVVDKQTWFLSG